MDTHGLKIDFGKHQGEFFTRIPVNYLKWMINNQTKQHLIAKAEFERRGDTMPSVELSGHAIDNASLRVLGIWQEKSQDGEGFYSWLQRITLEAIEHGIEKKGKIRYIGMKFVVIKGDEFPVLKTIMKE